MKTVSILAASAVLLLAGHPFAAEEGPVRVEIRGANPGPAAGNLGSPQGQNPLGAGVQPVAAWYIENMEKTVSLTPQQKETITQIYATRDKGLQEFQAKNGEKLQAAMKALTDAYRGKDQEVIAKALKEYQEISAETTRIHAQATTDLEKVLTPEQKKKREEVFAARNLKPTTERAVLTQLPQNPLGDGVRSMAAWYIENLEKSVALTPQQKEAMTKIIETRDKAAQEYQTKNADKLKAAMQAMTEAYHGKDKEAIARAQKEYQEASAESTRLYKQAQTDLDNVLTAEQKAKRQDAMAAQMIKSLTEPAVLTEEQVARMKAMLAKGNPGGEREERQWYQSIQDVLTPEQKAVVARHRALAGAKAGFGRANLTAEQWQKVEAAYDELAKKPGLNGEAVTRELTERVNGLLNAEQKEAMKKGFAGAAGGWQVATPSGQPGSPINKPAGSPQVVRLNEGGEGVTITINGDGKVTQSGAIAGAGRTFVLGEGRSEKGTWLGITTEPVSDTVRAQLSLAKGEGLVVGQVVPGSPAAAAGLAQHDILLRLDDQILVELSQLRKLIAMKKSGDRVKLVYLRKAARQEAAATLAEHEIESTERQSQWLSTAPGQYTLFEKGGAEGRELIERMQKRRSEEAAPATPQKDNRFTVTTAEAPLPPNPWKRGTPEGDLDHLRRQVEGMNLPAEAKGRFLAMIAREKERATPVKKDAEVVQKGGGLQPGAPLNPAPKKPE